MIFLVLSALSSLCVSTSRQLCRDVLEPVQFTFLVRGIRSVSVLTRVFATLSSHREWAEPLGVLVELLTT